MIKKFYVCSYGGSGSKMLCKSLKNMAKSIIYIQDIRQIY